MADLELILDTKGYREKRDRVIGLRYAGNGDLYLDTLVGPLVERSAVTNVRRSHKDDVRQLFVLTYKERLKLAQALLSME